MKFSLYVQPPVTCLHHFFCGFLLVSGSLFSSAATAQVSLNLPFFDDFSTRPVATSVTADQPDPARWQAGSGVYINNTLAVNQPTAGVASFDGLRGNGQPYVRNDQFALGYTDTLTSLPISLSGLTAADSVYLSFYWQIRGLGETPDPGDSLTLQFLDRTGAWQTVWRVEGGAPDNNFPQVFIPIRNTPYFHAGFAFRFRSYGRESGPFDTWSIDYVYLNRGRSVNDRFVKDVALRQPLSSLLKRYTAMPLPQYIANPAAETADSVTTDINNLFNNFNFTTFRFTVRDQVSGQLIQDAPQTNSVLIQSLSSQRKSVKPVPATGLATAGRAVLRYTFDLLTTDDQNPSIPGINLRRNDTLSASAVLDDYYAYDDGSWEYGLQVGPREQWAVRFIINKPDVVAGIRACIVPFRTNQTGQPFVINVYRNSNGRPGTVIYRKSFPTQYPTSRNGFVDFPFDKGVAVQDTFYIGYQQISSSDTTQFRLGFDKNSPFGRQIFYNGGSNWEQNGQNPNTTTLNLQGAFMLRPVLGGRPDTVVTATPEPVSVAHLRVYPTPTSGLIRWDDSRLIQVDVMSVSGRLLYRFEPGRGQQTLDLGHLPDGLYLLRLFDRQRALVQKLIIQH